MGYKSAGLKKWPLNIFYLKQSNVMTMQYLNCKYPTTQPFTKYNQNPCHLSSLQEC